MVEGKYGRKGSPWEFNLRDMFRWLELMTNSNKGTFEHPGKYLDMIYLQRMRTSTDREKVVELFQKIFGSNSFSINLNPIIQLTESTVQIGSVYLPRELKKKSHNDEDTLQLLDSFRNPMENLMKCIQMNWMGILTGNSASGKTSMVRLLAQLTGNLLQEFAMNSSVDTTEILGGFEQVRINELIYFFYLFFSTKLFYFIFFFH